MRFGWAYVNSVITGAVANGPTNSVQFNSGSQVLSGSSNFTFNPATNEVILLGELTGSTLVISASVVSASTYLGIPAGGSTTPGDGDKSIQFNSGSTFSGSTNLTFDYTTNNVSLTGSLTISGTSETSIHVSSSFTALKINQQGSGYAFIVEDQAGPDPSPFAITAAGDVGIGTSIPTEKLQVVGGIKSTTNISSSTAQFTTITGSTVTGSTALFTTITASVVSASNDILVGGQVISAGSIRSNGAIKGNYSTFSGNFNVDNTSYFVGIDSNASVITASLFAANNYFGGQSLIFKDIGGNGSTNNILIKPSGSQTIDGASGGVRITTNSGSITLVSNGSNQFYIVGSI